MRNAVLQRFDLDGRTVAITGGGGALCGAMADALGAMGARVAVLDLSLEKAQFRAEAINRSGGSALAFGCDVLDAAQLHECSDAIAAIWEPPALLVNGAGGNDPAGFRHVFDLNFMGTFLATQAFSRAMVANGKGSIVNISSMSAFVPLTKVAAYSAAKAAVSNFTQWLAVHFSHAGVRVNALAPGFFMTEQLRFLHVDATTGELLPRARQVIAHTPMGRYGEPDDLIGALVWLLSDASRFVTGVVVPIDGGFSAYSI